MASVALQSLSAPDYAALRLPSRRRLHRQHTRRQGVCVRCPSLHPFNYTRENGAEGGNELASL